MRAIPDGDRAVYGVWEGDAESISAFASPRTVAALPCPLKLQPTNMTSLERELRNEFHFRRLRKTRLFQKSPQIVFGGTNGKARFIELGCSIVARLKVTGGNEWRQRGPFL